MQKKCGSIFGIQGPKAKKRSVSGEDVEEGRKGRRRRRRQITQFPLPGIVEEGKGPRSERSAARATGETRDVLSYRINQLFDIFQL